jgi:hypothetical protein
MDEILSVLQKQIEEIGPKLKVDLLADRRIAAYKFFDKAYFYTDQLHNTDEPLDHWEQKLVFAMNYAVSLPKQVNRDELRREIAYARDVMGARLKSNPRTTDVEQRVFEIVEQFSLAGELV